MSSNAARNAENKYTGINLNAAAKLEKEEAERAYFFWKLAQGSNRRMRENPAKYEAEFRQRYANYHAKRGGTRRKHTRKYKKTYRKRR